MTNPYRALCAELLQELCCFYKPWDLKEERYSDAMKRARTLLAQPVAEGPTDDEMTQLLFEGFRGPIEFICDAEEEAHLMIRSHVKFARAVLDRWGRQPAPVLVSERLPEPKDYDAEGYCWRWNTIGGLWARQSLGRSWYEFESHWLPASALPTPEAL